MPKPPSATSSKTYRRSGKADTGNRQRQGSTARISAQKGRDQGPRPAAAVRPAPPADKRQKPARASAQRSAARESSHRPARTRGHDDPDRLTSDEIDEPPRSVSPGFIVALCSGGTILLFVVLAAFHRPAERVDPLADYGGATEESAFGPGYSSHQDGHHASSSPARTVQRQPDAHEQQRMAQAEAALNEALNHHRANPGDFADVFHMIERAHRRAHDTALAERCQAAADAVREAWDQAAQQALRRSIEDAQRHERDGRIAQARAIFHDFDPQLLPRVRSQVNAERQRLDQLWQQTQQQRQESISAILDLLVAGDGRAARERCFALRQDQGYADMAPWLDAAITVARHLDDRIRAIRRHGAELAGETLQVTSGDDTIEARCIRADETGLRLATRDGILHLPWANIDAAQRQRWRGSWTPQDPDQHMVAALEALRDGDHEGLRNALEAAGDHPLRAMIAARSQDR